MMSRRYGFLLLVLGLACAAPTVVPGAAAAQSREVIQEPPPIGLQTLEPQSEEEGALFLLLPNGAQGVGVGRAMTALSSSESAFWNPAGLADLDGGRIVIIRGDHLAGPATGFSAVLGGESPRAIAVSYQLLDVGTQDLTDDTGAVRGSITFRNHQAVVSGALGVGSRLRVGASAKAVQFRTTCRGDCTGVDSGASATAYAADLGVQARPFGGLPLRVGFMLAHLGPSFQVEGAEQADPLPARIRTAAAYDVLDDVVEEISMDVVLELEDRLRDPGHLSAYVGAELAAGETDRVFVRGGYIVGERDDTEGAALGFGLRYERFEFGFARSLGRGGPTTGDEQVHLTLGLVL